VSRKIVVTGTGAKYGDKLWLALRKYTRIVQKLGSIKKSIVLLMFPSILIDASS